MNKAIEKDGIGKLASQRALQAIGVGGKQLFFAIQHNYSIKCFKNLNETTCFINQSYHSTVLVKETDCRGERQKATASAAEMAGLRQCGQS